MKGVGVRVWVESPGFRVLFVGLRVGGEGFRILG
jgi:hypothetical protein